MHSTPIGTVNRNVKLQQQGLYANKSFKAGSNIVAFSAKEILFTPTYLTVQVDNDRHITLFPEYLQYINHSCNPNAFFNTTTMQLEALKEITKGEELTFFYPSTEWRMDQSFICSCGNKNCLKEIQGAYYLKDVQIENYRFTDFIKNKLQEKLKKKSA